MVLENRVRRYPELGHDSSIAIESWSARAAARSHFVEQCSLRRREGLWTLPHHEQQRACLSDAQLGQSTVTA